MLAVFRFAVEEAAKAADPDEIGKQADGLSSCLDKVEIGYEQEKQAFCVRQERLIK